VVTAAQRHMSRSGFELEFAAKEIAELNNIGTLATRSSVKVTCEC